MSRVPYSQIHRSRFVVFVLEIRRRYALVCRELKVVYMSTDFITQIYV